MNNQDNFTARRFPRIAHVSPRQIVRLDDAQSPHKNLVITKNLSPAGVCFSTNTPLTAGMSFLIYLNDLEIKNVCQNARQLVKTGDYYLARVVWVNLSTQNLFDIGASFFEREKSSAQDVETLAELVNVSVLEDLPTYASSEN